MSGRKPKRPEKDSEDVDQCVNKNKNDELLVIVEPCKLSPIYTNISYFGGNCIPFVGNCGFEPSTCNCCNVSEDARQNDCNGITTQKSVVVVHNHANNQKNCPPPRNRNCIDKASGPSCTDIKITRVKTQNCEELPPKGPARLQDKCKKFDELVVISEPCELSPVYTNISYFVGNCIPFVGNCRPFTGGACGFCSLICNAINNFGNEEDAWKKVTGARKSIIEKHECDDDNNAAPDYRGCAEKAREASCLEIDIKAARPVPKSARTPIDFTTIMTESSITTTTTTSSTVTTKTTQHKEIQTHYPKDQAHIHTANDHAKTSCKEEELVVIAEPCKLSPTYRTISYFVGNCIPFVGNCGFFPLICNTISNSGNNGEDAWKNLMSSRKSVTIQKHMNDDDCAASYIDEVSDPSCVEIIKPAQKRKTIESVAHTQTSHINYTTQECPPKIIQTKPKDVEMPTIKVQVKCPVDDCKRDEIVVISEPNKLSPVYTNISYFGGNCIPFAGNCGFFSLICNTLNTFACNGEDAWKKLNTERKSVIEVQPKPREDPDERMDSSIRPRKKSIRLKSIAVGEDNLENLGTTTRTRESSICAQKKLYDVEIVETKHVDLRGINAESVAELNESITAGLNVGLSGLREFVEKRS